MNQSFHNNNKKKIRLYQYYGTFLTTELDFGAHSIPKTRCISLLFRLACRHISSSYRLALISVSYNCFLLLLGTMVEPDERPSNAGQRLGAPESLGISTLEPGQRPPTMPSGRQISIRVQMLDDTQEVFEISVSGFRICFCSLYPLPIYAFDMSLAVMRCRLLKA